MIKLKVLLSLIVFIFSFNGCSPTSQNTIGDQISKSPIENPVVSNSITSSTPSQVGNEGGYNTSINETEEVQVQPTLTPNNNFAYIDWVNFVIIDDIQYQNSYEIKGLVKDSDIKEKIGEVKFNVSDNIHYTGYKSKNGDAAYLKKGTELFQLNSYSKKFRIVAKVENKFKLFESDTNPNAKKGADLVDINNKVKYITINSEVDGTTQLSTIKEQTKVNKLVRMVLDADVDQTFKNTQGERYFIEFHLIDGSSFKRCYWVESGELSRGILVSSEFTKEIKKALKK